MHHFGLSGLATVTVGAANLAATGLTIFWMLVFASAVIMTGIVINRLIPRHEY